MSQKKLLRRASGSDFSVAMSFKVGLLIKYRYFIQISCTVAELFHSTPNTNANSLSDRTDMLNEFSDQELMKL